jgi:hypothetical protein
MGPMALFDKSFLQSISTDEAVWFDHFFIPIICPVFYVETLGNLAKEETLRTNRMGRLPVFVSWKLGRPGSPGGSDRNALPNSATRGPHGTVRRGF